jgi:tRNA dimethylallyltransferase
MDRPKIVFITGPTAVGKSGLGHRLARELGGQIINADSMQVYRTMDIGTAKPTLSELKEVPYHLIDIVDPDQPFDAHEFRVRAQAVIRELHEGHIPILVVGGTGLYLRALDRGLFNCPKPQTEGRQRWQKTAEVQGPDFLWETLNGRDPVSAGRIHPRDTFRVIRALEVLEMTGRPISQWQQWEQRGEPELEILWIGLSIDRTTLYEKINARAEAMMAQGFIEEVRRLLAMGYTGEMKSMKSLGYRHLVGMLEGLGDLNQALEQIKRDTRHYAKRQLTWLAKEKNLNWFSPEEFDSIRSKVTAFF